MNAPVSGGYGCVDIRGGSLGSAFMGSAIRLFTHSAYDHAFIILDAQAGTILEAQPEGSHIGNLSQYEGLEMIFSPDSVLGGNVGKLAMAAEPFTGIPYGFLDIVYLGLSLGVHWRPQWLLDRVLKSKDMICSQLVAQFGVKYGANSWKCGQADPQLVTPGMLALRAGSGRPPTSVLQRPTI
jgi:hypothetical protein